MVMGDMQMKVDLLVVGAGPGGYAAAFRAADLGMDVALVDPREQPGGVCLHEGCIPSKTYLYLAELIEDAKKVQQMGVHFRDPEIDIERIRSWKKQVIDTMAEGLVSLNERRGIQYLKASAHFEDSNTARLKGGEISRIQFKQAIIATGSQPVAFPGSSFAENSRIMSSREALALSDIPEKLLVIGGGYVGLELGYVYSALGSKVHLVELEDHLLAGVDQDLVAPLKKRLQTMFARIDLGTKISGLMEQDDAVEVQLENAEGTRSLTVDRVLVAMGRGPAGEDLGLEKLGVKTDGSGFIQVDQQQKTTAENIFAVGDVCGKILLAHTAIRQGRVAAEAAAGLSSAYDIRAVPAVVYTDPQIAWCGLTEKEAETENIAVKVLKYPWKYSGRAQSMGAGDGLSKILVDPGDGRILGVGICGRDAEGLISEGVLAIEMGAVAEDLALSLHPHPTLSESLGEAAEIFLDSPTPLLPTKRS